MAKQKIKVEGQEITIYDQDGNDYISITDIARQVNERTDLVLSNWLRNAGTLDFLYEWEMLYNPSFKPFKFEGLRKNAGKVGFVMTTKRWIETTGAVGIIAKRGRGGGTYAHKDIAFEFCSAVSAKFKLLMIREFQELKNQQLGELGRKWNTNRYLARMNHHIHTDAIRNNNIPVMSWNTKREGVYFASEIDLLNQVVFGMTAKAWRTQYPERKGNLRDHAEMVELQVLANLEALNAELLEMGLTKDERRWRLEDAKKRHLAILETKTKKLD